MPNSPTTPIELDLLPGALRFLLRGTYLDVTRYYTLLSADGNPVPALGQQQSDHSIQLADIPPNILASLQVIDDWTRDLILAQFNAIQP